MKTSLRSRGIVGFTLVELLVGSSILILMFGFLLTASDQLTRVMGSTSAKVEQFRSSREAFERITSRLAQASLNTYWAYDNDERPSRYERRSELRFLSGHARDLVTDRPGERLGHAVFFNAPLGHVNEANLRGLETVLNTWGWFVEYGDDKDARPKFMGEEVAPRWRWRLMEFAPPSENFALYRYTSGALNGIARSVTYKGSDWIRTNSYTDGVVRPLVDNVIALVITPRLARVEEAAFGRTEDLSPLAPDFRYDSTKTHADPRLNPRNQLPPVVEVTMVAIDEKSAARLNLTSADWDLFSVAQKFKRTEQLTEDLSLESTSGGSLEQELVRRKVAYRVFTTNVHLRGAKWSREQIDTP